MISNFEQKRRDRPIDITDIAISKIPRTHFQGFSNEHNKFIQERHMELLSLVKDLNKLNNTNDMEAGILVDLHSWEYWIIKGKHKEVVMKDNKNAYKKLLESYKNQLLFMHNHPSTGTFSGVDLNTFCKYESLYIITAVGNDGSIYTLTKQPGFRSDIIMSEYTNLIRHYYNYYNNATKAMQDILKNADKFKLEYKKGRRKQK